MLEWADGSPVQTGLLQPADQCEWKLSLGLGIKLVVRVLLGESLLVQWFKCARTKIVVKPLFLLCAFGFFWQGNFHYDEILEVLQERTPKEPPVPVSGCHDLSVPADPHGQSCAPGITGLSSVCHCLQDKSKVQCCLRVLCVVLLLVFIFTKACSKPSLSKILLSESPRQTPWEHMWSNHC